jgi:hypothetical protein
VVRAMSVLRSVLLGLVVTPGGLVLAAIPVVALYRRVRGLSW